MKHRYTAIIVGGAALTAFALAFYGFVGYVAFNTRHVADQVNVWNYKPTAAITEQITRTKMSPAGKFLYLASRPTVQDKAAFNSTCQSVTGDHTVLGCYIGTTKRVYLYHVTDSRLDGTEEVMAAHEMLRAAWDRTSVADRTKLTPELERVLASNTDSTIALKQRVTAISNNDRTDREAELYAIVGTEVPDAGSILEKNYGQYFTDRKAVTDLNTDARAYAVALAQKVKVLTADLTSLDSTITSRVSSLRKSADKLRADVKAFNSRAETPGGFATQGQFDVARAALVERNHKLKKTVTSIRAQITDFNADLDELDELDKSAASLFHNLNDALPPLPEIGGDTA